MFISLMKAYVGVVGELASKLRAVATPNAAGLLRHLYLSAYTRTTGTGNNVSFKSYLRAQLKGGIADLGSLFSRLQSLVHGLLILSPESGNTS